jgi:hypothetical protein
MPAGWAAAAAAVYGAYSARKTAKEQAAAIEARQAQAEATGGARYGEAQALLQPYIERADVAQQQLMTEMGLAPGEAGTAYMQTPGYQSMMQERLGAVQQQQANIGQAYSGRRMQAAGEAGAGVQSQFYANYMNLLSGMASPSVAQNLASLGMGQAATMGAQGLQATMAAGQARARGQEAVGAATADIMQGWAAYQAQQPQTTQQTTQQQTTEEGEWL